MRYFCNGYNVYKSRLWYNTAAACNHSPCGYCTVSISWLCVSGSWQVKLHYMFMYVQSSSQHVLVQWVVIVQIHVHLTGVFHVSWIIHVMCDSLQRAQTEMRKAYAVHQTTEQVPVANVPFNTDIILFTFSTKHRIFKYGFGEHIGKKYKSEWWKIEHYLERSRWRILLDDCRRYRPSMWLM